MGDNIMFDGTAYLPETCEYCDGQGVLWQGHGGEEYDVICDMCYGTGEKR